MSHLERLVEFLTVRPAHKSNIPPSYSFMELFAGKQVRNLVHFTDYPIANEWDNLINDHRKLGLTKWLGRKHRSKDGYVFAFEVGSTSMWNSHDKYGTWAVSFSAQSILVAHYNDQEVQAITHTSLIRSFTLEKTENFISNLAKH